MTKSAVPRVCCCCFRNRLLSESETSTLACLLTASTEPCRFACGMGRPPFRSPLVRLTFSTIARNCASCNIRYSRPFWLTSVVLTGPTPRQNSCLHRSERTAQVSIGLGGVRCFDLLWWRWSGNALSFACPTVDIKQIPLCSASVIPLAVKCW